MLPAVSADGYRGGSLTSVGTATSTEAQVWARDFQRGTALTAAKIEKSITYN